MRKEFTQDEIRRLNSNDGVQSCTSKSITFTETFKTKALKRYADGLMPIQIFRDMGLDVNIIGRKTPKRCIERWRKQLKTEGSLKDSRGKHSKGGGRKPKEKIPKDEKERIKYLEAKVAYLEKENAFLAKLRAKRKEE
ncbi:MAG: HTH domain-containing protein [Candidatus Spechtbacterales bacterium]